MSWTPDEITLSIYIDRRIAAGANVSHAVERLAFVLTKPLSAARAAVDAAASVRLGKTAPAPATLLVSLHNHYTENPNDLDYRTGVILARRGLAMAALS